MSDDTSVRLSKNANRVLKDVANRKDVDLSLKDLFELLAGAKSKFTEFVVGLKK